MAIKTVAEVEAQFRLREQEDRPILDDLAKAAMQSFILKAEDIHTDETLRRIAMQSYRLARVMLEARSKV